MHGDLSGHAGRQSCLWRLSGIRRTIRANGCALARGNLIRAESCIPGVVLEDLCFDAQQAAEKAIKAVFICQGEAFPYVHELKKLLRKLKSNGVKIPKYVWEADKLLDYAVATRYPGEGDPVTPRQHRRAVRIAGAVLRWAERYVEGG